MLEKLPTLLIVIFAYCLPLIIACIFVHIFRKFIDKDSYSRDFISGLIYLIGVRETLKNFRFRRRR